MVLSGIVGKRRKEYVAGKKDRYRLRTFAMKNLFTIACCKDPLAQESME